jgi:hypothetical protein
MESRAQEGASAMRSAAEWITAERHAGSRSLPMQLFAPSAHRLYHFAFMLALSPGASLSTASLAADEPALAFDFGRTLECRDVTPPEYSAA